MPDPRPIPDLISDVAPGQSATGGTSAQRPRSRHRAGPDARGGVRLGARGERIGNAKLTEDIVRAMRLEHERGMTIAAIARMAGVHRNTARSAIRGETWWWVE